MARLSADRTADFGLVGRSDRRGCRPVGALAPLIGLDGRRSPEIAALAGRDRRSALGGGRPHQARPTNAPQPRATALPGVARLIAELDRRDIAWAIATSSRRGR
jgi:hypothetical protein